MDTEIILGESRNKIFQSNSELPFLIMFYGETSWTCDILKLKRWLGENKTLATRVAER